MKVDLRARNICSIAKTRCGITGLAGSGVRQYVFLTTTTSVVAVGFSLMGLSLRWGERHASKVTSSATGAGNEAFDGSWGAFLVRWVLDSLRGRPGSPAI